MELKISITQLKHSRESLTHRMNQAKEGKISGLKDKFKIRFRQSKQRIWEKINREKEHPRNIGYHEKLKPSNYRKR